jgi:hypothetical protein
VGHGVAKPRVRSLGRVRVSGKYLHVNAQADSLGIHASPVCESLLLPLRKRVSIRVSLAPHERMTSDHADERTSPVVVGNSSRERLPDLVKVTLRSYAWVWGAYPGGTAS